MSQVAASSIAPHSGSVAIDAPTPRAFTPASTPWLGAGGNASELNAGDPVHPEEQVDHEMGSGPHTEHSVPEGASDYSSGLRSSEGSGGVTRPDSCSPRYRSRSRYHPRSQYRSRSPRDRSRSCDPPSRVNYHPGSGDSSPSHTFNAYNDQHYPPLQHPGDSSNSSHWSVPEQQLHSLASGPVWDHGHSISVFQRGRGASARGSSANVTNSAHRSMWQGGSHLLGDSDWQGDSGDFQGRGHAMHVDRGGQDYGSWAGVVSGPAINVPPPEPPVAVPELGYDSVPVGRWFPIFLNLVPEGFQEPEVWLDLYPQVIAARRERNKKRISIKLLLKRRQTRDELKAVLKGWASE